MLLDSDVHHEPTGHRGTTDQAHHDDADVQALTLDATLSALCSLAEEPRVLGEVARHYTYCSLSLTYLVANSYTMVYKLGLAMHILLPSHAHTIAMHIL